MATERADWHFTASACRLGRELYYERIEAFELDGEKTWEVQSVETKKAYIARAAQMLNDVKPVREELQSPFLKYAKALDLRTQAADQRDSLERFLGVAKR